MKIYTKTGDAGETGLIGGGRIAKSDELLNAIGTLDEANACIGVARRTIKREGWEEKFDRIQSRLFDCGVVFASKGVRSGSVEWGSEVTRLEDEIDRMDAELPPLREFILPGGSEAGAALHVARAVVRRAERECTKSMDFPVEHENVLVWINRLSDWLFVAARLVNQTDGHPERTWVEVRKTL